MSSFSKALVAATVAVAGGALPASVARAAPDTSAVASARLGVSPMLVDAAAEVWGLIARPGNPVWPAWDASTTPLLLYLPGRQDLLINHPRPPAGFRPYSGPLSFPGAQMWVKDGPTLVGADGQNTAMDVAGARTLVVADPLSNLRQRVGGWIEDPRPAADKLRTLELEHLAPDPYEQLALVVHEAFHVYQESAAPERGANEMFLLFYPVLSVDNNVGFGLEASALAGAIAAPNDAAFRAAALRWLAVRLDRRRSLPARAIDYEDGTEFSEGLAKYAEYRLFQVLEGRTPSPGLARTQGFHGYGDLSFLRRNLIDEMVRNLRGEVNVNNDPYGTAPLRFRLYYSGMAIGLLLDRLSETWKRDVIAGGRSLTELARDALHPSAEDLAGALTAARADTAAATLAVAKARLAEEGRRRIAAKLAALEKGAGTRLVVDYSALASPKVGLSFTPFGITVVDSVRTFFEQVPIQAQFADESELIESTPLPLLRDTRLRELSCRLPRAVTRSELERQLGHPIAPRSAPGALRLEFDDLTLNLKNARVAWQPGLVRVSLHPAVADSAR